MKLECQFYDVCLPDYFPGHHLPYVQISVWKGMSLKEIKEQIRSEIHQGEVGGSGEDAYLLAADWLPEEKVKEADKLVKAAYAAINRLRPAKPRQRKFFTDLEPMDDDDDDDMNQVYAFFVFSRID